MTGKALAAAAGAVGGYVYYKRRQDPQSTFGTDPQDLVAEMPLANVAAATLAALVTRSAFAGFVVGFALSAVNGDKLNELVARKVREQRGSDTTQLTEVA